MTTSEFLDKYAPIAMRSQIQRDLTDLVEQQIEKSQSSVISKPSEVSGLMHNGLPFLEIGEGGEDGFYVITDDEDKAMKAADEYWQEVNSETTEQHYGEGYSPGKVSIHCYTKPWEDGEYSEWEWYKEGSEHEKSEWAFRFDE